MNNAKETFQFLQLITDYLHSIGWWFRFLRFRKKFNSGLIRPSRLSKAQQSLQHLQFKNNMASNLVKLRALEIGWSRTLIYVAKTRLFFIIHKELIAQSHFSTESARKKYSGCEWLRKYECSLNILVILWQSDRTEKQGALTKTTDINFIVKLCWACKVFGSVA